MNPSFMFSSGSMFASTLRAFFKQFHVLINTWAIAGAFEVTYEKQPGRPERMQYVDWQTACNYLEVFGKLPKGFPGSSGECLRLGLAWTSVPLRASCHA